MWQPIETAPKDGTEFQAWITNKYVKGFWEPRCKFDKDGRFLIFTIVDNIECEEDFYYFGPKFLTPTHWMPQPTEPTT